MEEAQGCGWLLRVRDAWEVEPGYWEWEGEYTYVPCGAEVTEHPNGWECAKGHSHFNDAEYFDDEELAGRSWLPANARRMDGSPLA